MLPEDDDELGLLLPPPRLLLPPPRRAADDDDGRPDERASATSDPPRTRHRMASEILMVKNVILGRFACRLALVGWYRCIDIE